MSAITGLPGTANGTAHGSGASVAPPRHTYADGAARSAASARPGDRVELSDRARELGNASVIDNRPIRQDKVDRIREEIRAGTYLTRDKLEAAADRLAESIDLRI